MSTVSILQRYGATVLHSAQERVRLLDGRDVMRYKYVGPDSEVFAD